MRDKGQMIVGRPARPARPQARAARWLDPDSLDVCAWAETSADTAETSCAADDEAIEPGDAGELETQAQIQQTQHRRPDVCRTPDGDL